MCQYNGMKNGSENCTFNEFYILNCVCWNDEKTSKIIGNDFILLSIVHNDSRVSCVDYMG